MRRARNGETIIFQPYQPDRRSASTGRPMRRPRGDLSPSPRRSSPSTSRKTRTTPERSTSSSTHAACRRDAAILGGRPCDARGFLVLDPVYKDVDPYYRERRERTTIITLACPRPYPGCFCTSLDSGPADKQGSDVLVTEVEGGYFLEAVTDKGKAVLDDPAVQEGASRKAEAEEKQKNAYSRVKKAFSGGKNVKISKERFLSDQFWEDVTAKCLSCGACTYPLPYVLLLQHYRRAGRHTRASASEAGTRACSPTSPWRRAATTRGRKRPRGSNRGSATSSSTIRRSTRSSACSGCGRCIRYCPISMEISKVVAKLADEGDGGEKEDVEGAHA